jgi:hypothetical protein
MADAPTLTLLICTRGRLEQVRACAEQAIEQAQGWPLHIVVGFDDDAENYIAFQENIEAAQLPRGTSVSAIALLPRHYYVRAINALFIYAQQSIEGFDYFVLSNDDVEWTPGWAQHAYVALCKSYDEGLGVCALDQPDACAHYISRAKFFNEELDGMLGEPCYTFYFSDRELLNRLKLMARYRYIGPIVKHVQQRDKVRSEVERWWRSDEYMFFRRRVEHPEWPDDGVPRKVWIDTFGGPVGDQV